MTKLHTPPPPGTYNNQYMVVDRSRVKLGHWVEDGALTVVEQIPGLVEFSDQSQTLRRGLAPPGHAHNHEHTHSHDHTHPRTTPILGPHPSQDRTHLMTTPIS